MAETVDQTPLTETTQKKKSKLFDFNRIKDKLVAIVVITLTILTVITSVVTYQNSKTKEILDNISDLRIPVPILTADILSGANRVSASQRAYMMTGDEKYKQERLDVWRHQINPSAKKLIELKSIMRVQEHRQIVDRTTEQLASYEQLQDEIDTFFEKKLKGFVLNAEGSDSLSLATLAERVQLRNTLDEELDSLVAGDASRARKSLRAIITPLNQAQEELLVDDNNTVNSRIQASTQILIITSILGLILIIAFSVLLFKSLTKSIRSPTELLTAMSKGTINSDKRYSKDELNDIFIATNMLSENMIKASDFALNIGEGNFQHHFQPAGIDDKLGNSLIQMRDKLQVVSEEDKKRNWSTEGLAKFADILRSDASDIETLSNKIVSELVKYCNANQGSIFVLDSNGDGGQEVMNLAGCYAWDRQKYIDKKITKGEGLIGQAWLEGENIYLEEIPDNFIQIRSGLGNANPTSILITPIKTDKAIEGVLELAFFHRLEGHHLDFIEKLCTNIAATLSSTKINERTQNLLEQSQQQAEELRAQEEEMRQNMEELTATQEEMDRKDIERTGQINAINSSMATIEFDVEGYITTANARFLEVMGYTLDEIQGKHHKIFIDQQYAGSQDYTEFWQALKNGIAQTGEAKRFSKTGKVVWLNASYTPVLDRANKIQKIIKFAIDITDEKLRSIEHEGQMTAINKTLASIEFNLDGTIVTANNVFLEAMGYSLDEIKGKHHKIFVDSVFANSNEYKQFWSDLSEGLTQSGEFKRFDKHGQPVWLSANYTPIMTPDGKIYKVVKFAQVTTNEKNKSLNFQGQINAINNTIAAIEFDLNGIIMEANELFLNTMLYSLEEVQGYHHSIFVDKSYAESKSYKEFWEVLGQGHSQTGEFKRFDKLGNPVWLSASYTPIMNSEGKVFKIIKFAHNVTEEKLKSLEFEGQISAINNTMGSIEFKLDGMILHANEIFLKAMGYKLTEVKGHHHKIFVDEEYAMSEEYKNFWEDLRNGKSQTGEFNRLRKDKSRIKIMANYTPILDDEGKPFKIIKFAQVVSEVLT
ncbi:MAG: PAS domain-containing protein [Bacteroidota bacterium]